MLSHRSLLCAFVTALSIFASVKGQCSLCPAGTSMGSPGKVLPASGQTCLGLEETVLSHVPSDECEDTKDTLVGEAVVDLFSFCGCQGADPPFHCDLCGSEISTTRAQLSASTGSGDIFTCSEISELAQYIVDNDYCSVTSETFSSLCCDSDAAEDGNETDDDSCSICPPGSEMGNGESELSFLGGRTCLSVEQELSEIPKSSCPLSKFSLFGIYDGAALCGCQGFEPPHNCELCGADEVPIDPSTVIPGGDGLTCGDARHLVSYMSSSSACEIYGVPMRSLCCQPGTKCSVCPRGLPTENPDKKVLLGEEYVTCDVLDSILGTFSIEECSSFFDESGSIDIPFWCGCEGVPAPGQCELCPDGLILDNADLEIPDSGGRTCGDIASLAYYVTDEHYCEANVEILTGGCCKFGSRPVLKADLASAGTTPRISASVAVLLVISIISVIS